MARRALVFGVMLLLASVLIAQTDRGAMSGTVTNPDGDIVAGVRIQAKLVPGEMTYNTESSRSGSFSFSQLPAGTYELSVPGTGFTNVPYLKKNLLVQAGRTLTADIRLEWPINLGTVGDDTFLTLRNRYAGLSGPTPRMPDGKPDLSGIWNGSGDPNPEQPAVLPWAAEVRKERFQNNLKDLPSARCLPGEAFPSAPLLYKIIQSSSLLVQLFEDVDGFRQVFLDGRGQPKDPDPTWPGHSIGSWDGDTLVIDTVGFNDKGWLLLFPHTEMLHIVERYRRPDLAQPQY